MKKMTAIGRILFAIPFLLFGINHFLMTDYYVGMLTSFVPNSAYSIIIVGVVLILTSISIITKRYVRISTIILACLLFIFIVTIHIPHLFIDADRTTAIITMLKDVSLLGGCLMIAGTCSGEENAGKA